LLLLIQPSTLPLQRTDKSEFGSEVLGLDAGHRLASQLLCFTMLWSSGPRLRRKPSVLSCQEIRSWEILSESFGLKADTDRLCISFCNTRQTSPTSSSPSIYIPKITPVDCAKAFNSSIRHVLFYGIADCWRTKWCRNYWMPYCSQLPSGTVWYDPFVSRILGRSLACSQRIFDCPFTGRLARTNKVVLPLAKFGQLRTLAIPAADGISWAYSVFKLCPLQVIHIKRPVQEWEQSDLPKNDPVLMALLKFPQLT
jgi:hypothetical protein